MNLLTVDSSETACRNLVIEFVEIENLDIFSCFPDLDEYMECIRRFAPEGDLISIERVGSILPTKDERA